MPGSGRWTRWRARRALGDAVPPEETITRAVALEPDGWWAITEAALYVLRNSAPPRRIPRSEVKGVRAIGHVSMKQLTISLADGTTVSANIAASSRFTEALEGWVDPA